MPKPQEGNDDFVTIAQLVTSSDSSERTINRKLAKLKKNDRKLYDTLIRKVGHAKVYHQQKILAYINSPSVGITPPKIKKIAIPGIGDPKRKLPPTKFSTEAKSAARNIWEEPTIIQMDEYEKHQYDKIDNELDKERFQMVILVLNDWVTGLYNLPTACQRQGGSYTTFWHWVHRHEALKALYRKAKKKREKAWQQIRIEESENALKRLINGEERDVETVTYMEKTLANGNKIMMPTDRKVTKKITSPNVTAIIFALTNDKPKQWKRLNAFDEPAAPKQDPVDLMSERELQQLLDEGKENGSLE